MKEVVKDICNILHDYHKYNGFNLNEEWIVKWISQFDQGNQEFILQEFLHLLKQGIYIDENKARELLLKGIKGLAANFKFNRLRDFLENAEFVLLQPDGKSQSFLLGLLETVFRQEYGIGLENCGTKSKKYVIYLDDILATGGTVFNNTREWMNRKDESGELNYNKVIKKEKFFIVHLFCIHTWAHEKLEWKLKREFGDDMRGKLIYRAYYVVENHPSKQGQKLNFAYPDKNQPNVVMDYINGLSEIGVRQGWPMTNANFALRNTASPLVESFYSSATNRKRFEDIFLIKGIEILGRVNKLSDNHRPMGVIQPSYQTLGLGTLFFTWRNISNTTPIVFWWNNNGWSPLFELVNRGASYSFDTFD